VETWNWSSGESGINPGSLRPGTTTAYAPPQPQDHYTPPPSTGSPSFSQYEDSYIEGYINYADPVTIVFPDGSSMTVSCTSSYCSSSDPGKRKYFRLWLPTTQGTGKDTDKYCFNDATDKWYNTLERGDATCGKEDIRLTINGTIIDRPLDGTWTILHARQTGYPQFGNLAASPRHNQIRLNVKNKTFISGSGDDNKPCNIRNNYDDDCSDCGNEDELGGERALSF
jgi:hypothetical protein